MKTVILDILINDKSIYARPLKQHAKEIKSTEEEQIKIISEDEVDSSPN